MCGETSAARATAIGDGLVSSVLPVSLACWVGIGMVPTAAAPTPLINHPKRAIFSAATHCRYIGRDHLRPAVVAAHFPSETSDHFPGLFGGFLDVLIQDGSRVRWIGFLPKQKRVW